jgi:ERCC4-type nuclease
VWGVDTILGQLFIDDREKKHVIDLGKHYFPDAIVKRLDTGDAVYIDNKGNEVICWERKKKLDLPASKTDKRLDNQSKRMRENFKYGIIMFIGDHREICNDWHYQDYTEEMYFGTEASLIIGHDLKFIHCYDEHEYWKKIRAHIRKYDEYNNGQHVEITDNSFKRDKKLSPEVNALRSCVSGIGKAKAEKIFEFYTLHDLFHVSERDLAHTVPGVGVKMARRIKSVFRSDNDG